jgi:hypothetical protein
MTVFQPCVRIPHPKTLKTILAGRPHIVAWITATTALYAVGAKARDMRLWLLTS